MEDTLIWTDPARELAELCDALSPTWDNTTKGEAHLASHFGVDPWSREFYEITFTIMDRVNHVAQIVGDLPIDEDIRAEAVNHIRKIGGAFTAHALRQAWGAVGAAATGPANVQPIKMLSSTVRLHVKYRRLSDDEVATTLSDVATLREWLENHQLADQDFIRQALIGGLRQFEFRLSRLKWLGWGYTLEGLREVLAAYMALERTETSAADNPDAEAALKKLGSLLKKVYERMAVVRDVAETGDFLLRAYGLVAGATWVSTSIAGLLPSS